MEIKIDKEKLLLWGRFVVEDLGESSRILREKGANHFQRPFIAAALVYFACWFIYRMPSGQKDGMVRQIAQAKAISQHASRFSQLSLEQDRVSAGLPNPTDKDKWLADIVRSTMGQEGIDASQISPVREHPLKDYNYATINVTCTTTYSQLARWISRLERSKWLLRVEDLGIVKDEQSTKGENRVTITLGTLLNKSKGAR